MSCHAPITLIQGHNATGKTSILEALYYAAYLRSFRTTHPSDMIAFGNDAFTIGIDGMSHDNDNNTWHLHIGCSQDKRIVKKNQHTISSYKDLLTFYRVMHIIEDDMDIIKGGPKSRRTFLDQSLVLYQYAYATMMRQYKKALAQRNALLAQGVHNDTIWLEQMWSYAYRIVSQRHEWLTLLQHEVNALLESFFTDVQVTIQYAPKYHVYDDFATFYDMYSHHIHRNEAYSKRVRFGPHLDDITIELHNASTRTFASRGQQKMVMLILKLAAIRLVDMPVILLVDDMFADFDEEKIQRILDMLAHKSHQIIMTTPSVSEHLAATLKPYDHHTVSISNA